MPIVNEIVVSRQVRALRTQMGPEIAEALNHKYVVEVMLNDDGQLWVDQIGEGRKTIGTMAPDKAENIIRLVANHVGDLVGRDAPAIAGTLPESGERFQGLLPPIVGRPSFTIRKRPEIIYTFEDYLRDRSITEADAQLLQDAAESRKNILIIGGTGSGKTTFANAILALDAFTRDRILMIEDTPELQCSAPDKLHLLTKKTDPPVTMRDLIRHALRLRPDRIIVGEVRGGEALDMLKAWNTGHPGGLATAHANSATDALRRVEEMIGEVAANIPYRSIASAIDLIVFIARTKNGRELKEILAVRDHQDGEYVLENVRRTGAM